MSRQPIRQSNRQKLQSRRHMPHNPDHVFRRWHHQHVRSILSQKHFCGYYHWQVPKVLQYYVLCWLNHLAMRSKLSSQLLQIKCHQILSPCLYWGLLHWQTDWKLYSGLFCWNFWRFCDWILWGRMHFPNFLRHCCRQVRQYLLFRTLCKQFHLILCNCGQLLCKLDWRPYDQKMRLTCK